MEGSIYIPGKKNQSMRKLNFKILIVITFC